MQFVVKGFCSAISLKRKDRKDFFITHSAELNNATDEDTKGLNLPLMAVWPCSSNPSSLHSSTVSLNPEPGRKRRGKKSLVQSAFVKGLYLGEIQLSEAENSYNSQTIF